MVDKLKSWSNILQDIENNTNIKNVLLGNGFSMCWDYEKFNQSNLKSSLEILNTVNGENVENCIEILKNSIDSSNNYKTDIQKIIDIKINSDLIRVLFNKLPKKIELEKSEPFVKFLKLFNNYFTLNYDSLLYFLLNKFKNNSPAKMKKLNINQENLVNIIKPIVDDITNRRLFSQKNNGEYEEIGKLSNEKMDFIRKQIINELKNQKDNYQEINSFFDGRGLKGYYKSIINNYIAESQDGIIKPELKILDSQDGFKTVLDELLWDKNINCNLFHLHGAYHIIQFGENIKKMSSTNIDGMLENIEKYLNDGNMPVSVLDGTWKNKISKINDNPYLSFCYEKFKQQTGILITLGVSFADNDQHIVDAIVNNENLETIYIGLWKDDNIDKSLENMKTKFQKIRDKVIFYTYNDTFKKQEVNNDQVNE